METQQKIVPWVDQRRLDGHQFSRSGKSSWLCRSAPVTRATITASLESVRCTSERALLCLMWSAYRERLGLYCRLWLSLASIPGTMPLEPGGLPAPSPDTDGPIFVNERVVVDGDICA